MYYYNTIFKALRLSSGIGDLGWKGRGFYRRQEFSRLSVLRGFAYCVSERSLILQFGHDLIYS